jgi:hypothetical protein
MRRRPNSGWSCSIAMPCRPAQLPRSSRFCVSYNNWLMFNYEHVDQIDHFQIWKRKLQPG